MTKQEFLAFSLPYDVKAIDKFECIWTIHPYKDALDDLEDNEHLSYENFIKEEGHKFILRPLSDLTKEIEHKGERFIPIERLLEDITNAWRLCKLDYPNDSKGLYNDIISNIESCEFWLIQKLVEWHFNLMDIGEEFIDVNTLEENPYK